MYLAPEKSSVTLFTSDTHQYGYHPLVFLDGALIPLEKNPKILGVTLDPLLTFGPHAKTVVDKVGARLKVLKALAGTDWGHSPEDLSITFKSLVSSVINYAAPIYSPNLKPCNITKLQRSQNQCLRVITGAHTAASLEHLHRETRILPVEDHLALMSRQFLAQASVESHPSFAVVPGDPGPRDHRHTLASKHGQAVAPFLRGGSMPRDNLRDSLTDPHTAAVARAVRIQNLSPSKVLGYHPPAVDDSEQSLPRAWRSTLSQLRSGYCRALKSYTAVLNNTDDLCPDCQSDSQSVSHLFLCPEFPSTCEKVDLWCNPCHAAHFLSRLPCFSHLPQISAPPGPWLPRPLPPSPPPPIKVNFFSDFWPSTL